jgi:hypothetical protein
LWRDGDDPGADAIDHVYLVIATLASFISAAAGAEYYWAVISGDVIHLAMIAALWLPASAREFFAAHRRHPG